MKSRVAVEVTADMLGYVSDHIEQHRAELQLTKEQEEGYNAALGELRHLQSKAKELLDLFDKMVNQYTPEDKKDGPKN